MSAQIEPVSYPFPAGRDFDEIIDVRSPGEFAEDHLTGAINLPVLSDQERERVGTLYLRDHFEGRKLGAALVSANIAGHLRTHFAAKPRGYRPLVYCWRGGQRSQSLATILGEIGWRVAVLAGGYKAYRREVLQALEQRANQLRFCVLNGLTGSGKTRVLRELEALGAQVVNLEDLARHRGSVFGSDPGDEQPAQKRFESLLYDRLISFHPGRPVYLEAESPRIGRLNIPPPLWKSMREAETLAVELALDHRVALLESEYQSWLAQPGRVLETLDLLRPFHPRERVELWRSWCREGNWRELIESLLRHHYDARYGQSGAAYFVEPGRGYRVEGPGIAAMRAAAAAILDDERARGAAPEIL